MDERVKKFRELMDGPNELKALQRELERHLRRYGDAEVFGDMLILKDEAYIESEFKLLDIKRCRNDILTKRFGIPMKKEESNG